MRIFYPAFLLILSCSTIQAVSPDSALFLIPQPKKIEIGNGAFSFSNPFAIRISNTNEFYSELLMEAVTQKFKTKATTSAANEVKLIKADTATLSNILKSEKFKLPFDLGSEGYILSVSAKGILVIASENAGVFYGVQTLIQLIKGNSQGNTIPCVVIYDKPVMAMRGWQDDISRGPIPTLDFLKEEIRRMSSFKLNTFTLYTEHVFKLKKHPAIAPAYGITAEEIKELTVFARNYHRYHWKLSVVRTF